MNKVVLLSTLLLILVSLLIWPQGLLRLEKKTSMNYRSPLDQKESMILTLAAPSLYDEYYQDIVFSEKVPVHSQQQTMVKR